VTAGADLNLQDQVNATGKEHTSGVIPEYVFLDCCHQYGHTPLMNVTQYERRAALEALLKAGADVTLHDKVSPGCLNMFRAFLMSSVRLYSP
jgi:ATP-dependent DNA ligase